MKLQIVSDLHLEFNRDTTYIGVTPAPGADALVIAGDIAKGTNAPARFQSWPVPVVYITGNHEFYGQSDLGKTVAALREQCAGTNVYFLELDCLTLPDFPEVRILGTCLWTDYLLFGRPKQALAMRACNEELNDHSRIRSGGKRFAPKDAMYRHVASKAWLAEQLAMPFAGKTVVLTHHGCHWNSVADQWRDDIVSAGFSSDLTVLLDQADLWIHGHMHDSFDYQVGRARVVVNPRGYPDRNGTFENPGFNEHLVVEV